MFLDCGLCVVREPEPMHVEAGHKTLLALGLDAAARWRAGGVL